ncbi:unnamed protein product [Darwinula stevensoni]|uniref:Uncharacterized protein n=1 Tax=Darwinula stevensoni TaxID=69355 RepID=A0A7R8XGB9_9CRUS|nr:unnamed protein product [Darwinula stevensoni]CAG0889551.1 unnamed protein product [Darwinula stevensoni]
MAAEKLPPLFEGKRPPLSKILFRGKMKVTWQRHTITILCSMDRMLAGLPPLTSGILQEQKNNQLLKLTDRFGVPTPGKLLEVFDELEPDDRRNFLNNMAELERGEAAAVLSGVATLNHDEAAIGLSAVARLGQGGATTLMNGLAQLGSNRAATVLSGVVSVPGGARQVVNEIAQLRLCGAAAILKGIAGLEKDEVIGVLIGVVSSTAGGAATITSGVARLEEEEPRLWPGEAAAVLDEVVRLRPDDLDRVLSGVARLGQNEAATLLSRVAQLDPDESVSILSGAAGLKRKEAAIVLSGLSELDIDVAATVLREVARLGPSGAGEWEPEERQDFLFNLYYGNVKIDPPGSKFRAIIVVRDLKKGPWSRLLALSGHPRGHDLWSKVNICMFLFENLHLPNPWPQKREICTILLET